MDNWMNCVCNALEEIDGFNSISEFERFQKYLADLVNKQELRKLRVKRIKKYYTRPVERYKCVVCYSIWKLEFPDFPLRGSWKRVK